MPISNDASTRSSDMNIQVQGDHSSTNPPRIVSIVHNIVNATVHVVTKKLEKQQKHIVDQRVSNGLGKLSDLAQKYPTFSQAASINASSLNKLCNQFIQSRSADGLQKNRFLTDDSGYQIVIGNNQAYLILSEIGKGKDKVVFVGINLTSGDKDQLVAVTIMSGNPCADFNENCLSDTNFKKLHKLSCQENSGLVPLIGVMNISTPNKKTQVVVQKLCVQGDLRDLLNKQRDLRDLLNEDSEIPPETVYQYSQDIFNGVLRLTNNGFMPSDLKPENILLDDEGHAYLGDPESWLGKRQETFCYSSPDLIVNYEEGLTKESVAFTLGNLFYFLWSGNQSIIAWRLEEMLNKNGPAWVQSEIMNHQIPLAYLKGCLEWEQSHYNPESESLGEQLVSQLMRAEKTNRISIADSYEIFKNMQPEDLFFSFYAFPEQ